jgi:hypothetical protein
VANVVLVLVVIVVVLSIGLLINRRRHGIVAERGISIGADLGAMRDQPRMRVRSVTTAAPERVRVVLTPDSDPGDTEPTADLEFVVTLRDDDFGLGLLQQWQRTGASLAFVMPEGSHLVRLRSIDDLQPITLRRVEE